MTTIKNVVSDNQENAIEGYHTANSSGVYGHSVGGPGVQGNSDNDVGVRGASARLMGVQGLTQSGWGVNGESQTGIGVRGVSTSSWGVRGESAQSIGVYGVSEKLYGVNGDTVSGVGVRGAATSGWGVDGESQSGVGVRGVSTNGWGVTGESPNGIGVRGAGKVAGRFEGDVEVTGDIRLTNADCAEDFDVVEAVDACPGTVMVIDSKGALKPCSEAYDKCVAGVVSGAGDFKPAIVLDKQEASENRKPIALIGKVYCKVDATYGAIAIGNLLTSSPNQGHAMKVANPVEAIGAILGKALASLDEGQGLIPILVALQ